MISTLKLTAFLTSGVVLTNGYATAWGPWFVTLKPQLVERVGAAPLDELTAPKDASLMPAADPWGCCYNVGLVQGGECCQSPTQGGDVLSSNCKLEQRMGGATWFAEYETCEWMEKNVWCGADCTNYPLFKIAKPQVPVPVPSADPLLSLVRNPMGCCYSVVFIPPYGRDDVCCQQPAYGGDVKAKEACPVKYTPNGAIYFAESTTCEWMEDNVWGWKGLGSSPKRVRIDKPNAKASPSLSLAAASSDPMGCCFNVGLAPQPDGGNGECCQQPTQGGDVLKSNCQLATRMGGATWFVESQTCAWLEQNIWSKGFLTSDSNVMLDRPEVSLVAAASPWGCCFNVGLTASRLFHAWIMKECCQTPTQGGDVQLSSCNLQQRQGGATWFVEFQTCQWMKEQIWSKGLPTTSSNVRLNKPNPSSLVAAYSYNPQGCCFDVGLTADGECCQTPTQGGDVRLSSCHLEQRLGGATWFAENETCEWMEEYVWGRGLLTTFVNVKLDKPSRDNLPAAPTTVLLDPRVRATPTMVLNQEPEGDHPWRNAARMLSVGCCYAFGYGDRMKPCCFEALLGDWAIKADCDALPRRIGVIIKFVQDISCQKAEATVVGSDSLIGGGNPRSPYNQVARPGR